MHTIKTAQLANAAYYRAQARMAPWNSKTRAGWLQLAVAAENCAARH